MWHFAIGRGVLFVGPIQTTTSEPLICILIVDFSPAYSIFFVPLSQEDLAMTRQEAEYLQRLERAFGGLSQLLERQQVYISELQARMKHLERERLRLEESLTTEQQKNNALLTARMIIAQDKDWADARQRLVGLKKNIQEALRLLETE